MKNLDINALLDKYWKAETSLEEEDALRSYFLYGNVTEEHEPFRPMFAFYTQEKSRQYQKALAFESDAKVKPLHPWRRRMMSVAAVFLVLFAASWIFKTYQDEKSLEEQYAFAAVEDPEEAFDVTMQALALLGGKLNESSKQIQQNISYTDKMNIIKPNQ